MHCCNKNGKSLKQTKPRPWQMQQQQPKQRQCCPGGFRRSRCSSRPGKAEPCMMRCLSLHQTPGLLCVRCSSLAALRLCLSSLRAPQTCPPHSGGPRQTAHHHRCGVRGLVMYRHHNTLPHTTVCCACWSVTHMQLYGLAGVGVSPAYKQLLQYTACELHLLVPCSLHTCHVAQLMLCCISLQDLGSAGGDSGVLDRISRIITYLRDTGGSRGSKKAERDSNYIRSILAGVNPAAPGEQQVW